MRHDLFNRKYPTPLDRFAYPIYKDFQILKDEINNKWVRAITLDELGKDIKYDFQDNRIRVTDNGSVIASQLLVLDEDTELKLKVYMDFFTFYKDQIDNILAKITTMLIAKEFPDNDYSKEVFEQWAVSIKQDVSERIWMLLALSHWLNSGSFKDGGWRDVFNLEDPDSVIRKLDTVTVNNFVILHQRMISSFWQYSYKEANRTD